MCQVGDALVLCAVLFYSFLLRLIHFVGFFTRDLMFNIYQNRYGS